MAVWLWRVPGVRGSGGRGPAVYRSAIRGPAICAIWPRCAKGARRARRKRARIARRGWRIRLVAGLAPIQPSRALRATTIGVTGRAKAVRWRFRGHRRLAVRFRRHRRISAVCPAWRPPATTGRPAPPVRRHPTILPTRDAHAGTRATRQEQHSRGEKTAPGSGSPRAPGTHRNHGEGGLELWPKGEWIPPDRLFIHSTAEDEAGVGAAKAERIRKDNVNFALSGVMRHQIDGGLDGGVVEVDRRRCDSVADCQN
jgi:hypothetical protein